MKYVCPLLAVNDIEKSKEFYKEILGLDVEQDFGANVVLTGGVALQTKESWIEFIGKEENEITQKSNNFEIYFEEDDFDCFIEKLKGYDIEYVHEPFEHRWGQRVVRFYDLDKHIIEVGENLKSVVERFYNSGMNIEQVSNRMDVSNAFVENCIK